MKGVIANLESQLEFEHTTRETDKWWYKGILDEMTKRHQDSSLQRTMIKQRLSKKDAQVQELMQTIKEMSGSMEEMKNQLAQVSRGTRQSLERGPTFAIGIPDAGSIATTPRFPTGRVGNGGILLPWNQLLPLQLIFSM